MRLAFMGTPGFSVPALLALHQAGHEIAAVYSQPPRPAGRGHVLTPSPVQREAERLGLPVRTPERLRRDEAEHAAFRALELDAAVVVAYGLILPAAMLDAPRRGCLNIHASLLPRWRGAAPFQAAILAGDTECGVTIMQMDPGLDTGPMLRAEAVPIGADTDATMLHDSLSALGARLIVEELAHPSTPVKQDESLATLVPKLSRADGRLDFTQPAVALDRRVRAMTPWPGASTTLDGVPLKIGRATPVAMTHRAPPGTALDDRLLIACGDGALRLDRLQAPGRAMMEADAFLRGRAVPAGSLFT
ncbi:methionyl-tRNA formyltransferase [Acetobacteraceae bacterium KSS8]|uniref:Methionyl-tRNA formyltransferase n=1 Tax=Endosaccharibacter trunci TaxID=2812733 RepID=A0ABT1W9A8_9PROT|nr:methionyl-tRNA formyltransferase [Acetobacteraceae bacterium KSS8]